jgi:hypothetical protein
LFVGGKLRNELAQPNSALGRCALQGTPKHRFQPNGMPPLLVLKDAGLLWLSGKIVKVILFGRHRIF